MAKSAVRQVTITSFGSALQHVLEPVIRVLDQHAPTESGHELPSRKDGLLRILLNNFCRDIYQQIHGVNTENYKFAGVKDNWDRAEQAVTQLVSRYANNPEDMEADPNCAKFASWYETASAKMECLQSLLTDSMDVYKSVTGEDWKYIAPGTKTQATKMTPAEAVAKIKQVQAARAA